MRLTYFQESWNFGTKFEKCESIISSDVFAAVAIIVAKVPLHHLLEVQTKVVPGKRVTLQPSHFYGCLYKKNVDPFA